MVSEPFEMRAFSFPTATVRTAIAPPRVATSRVGSAPVATARVATNQTGVVIVTTPLWLDLASSTGNSVTVPPATGTYSSRGSSVGTGVLSPASAVGVGTAGEPGVAAQPVTVAAGVDTGIDSVRRMSGVSLLAGLSRLSIGDISTFVAEFPGQVDSLLAVPPAASEVTGWWAGLGGTERSSLLAAAPRLVGNLDGIPFRERGRANARFLSQSLTEVGDRLTGSLDDGTRETLTREQAVLTQVEAALQPSEGGPHRSLIILDTVGGGRAAIALGNPDTAAFVSYLVPGMNYAVEAQIVNWTATAEALYEEQRTVLAERAATGRRSGGTSLAVVSWIGYEAPDLFSVGGLDHAIIGADFLEKYSQGLRADRVGDQPYVSLFAHSYGSTVALTALSRGSFEVDALVLVGSPGSQIQSVDSLGVAGGNVFVGKADWDPAVNSAFFGSDPGAESYGAHPLGVYGAHDRLTGAWLAGSLGHNAYFDRGSESLHNMALIGTDNADLVTNGSE